MSAPPVIARLVRRPAPPVERAARLAAIWGWSYVVTIVALAGLREIPHPSILYDWLLQTSLLFTLLGVLELVWRRRLLATRQAKWVRVLAANEVAGTLALVWCVAWLGRVPVAELTRLLTPGTMKTMEQLYAAVGQRLDEDVIRFSFSIAKTFTMYGIGGLLLLSQIWVIIRYLMLASAMQNEPRRPPVLARG